VDCTGRIVGLDVGDVRIGVAVSDPLGVIATPRTVIKRTSIAEDVHEIRSIVEETQAVCIVAGMPLNREGKPGPQARKVAAFLEALGKVLDIPIRTQDERYSTASATRSLRETGVKGKRRKQFVDQVAAQQILQTYLDRRHREARLQ
jgi:putative holliday junction resolvase